MLSSSFVGRALAGLIVAFVATGCIFLTPPIDPGEHCTFEGQSDCATCMRANCVKAIDKACSEIPSYLSSETSVTLDAVDTCGRGDASECAAALDKLTSTDEVVSCITSSCRSSCLSGQSAAPTAWSCATSREPTDETSACASCIYEKCAADITECCDDVSCSSSTDIAGDMGACIASDKPGCLYSQKGSTSGFAGKLRGCIAQSCEKLCFPSDRRVHNTCTLVDSGRACTCTDSREPGKVECSETSIGSGSACVLGRSGCSCGRYTCEIGAGASTTCGCSFRGDGVNTNCVKDDSSDHCCIKVSGSGVSCACGISSCIETLDEYESASCDAATVSATLQNGGFFVDRCSN